MYRLVCLTCSEEQLFEEFESAQESFNRHAADGHAVELIRREAPSMIPE